jgi:hypothetical protein
MATSSENVNRNEYSSFMNHLDSLILGDFGITNPGNVGVHAGAVAPRQIQHYAPSIVMSEDEFPGGERPARRGRPRYSPSEAGSSSSDAASIQASSVFDDDNWTMSSISTAPSLGSVSDDGASAIAPSVDERAEDDASGILPCEFVAYTGCGARFSIDDVDGWVYHIAVEHMDSILPRAARCWFCRRGGSYCVEDDEVTDMTQNEMEALFRDRMEHIADHFRNEKTDKIRPDFRFLEHVYVNGFIDDEMFEAAKQYTLDHGRRPPKIRTKPWKKQRMNEEVIIERSTRNGRREPRLQVVLE